MVVGPGVALVPDAHRDRDAGDGNEPEPRRRLVAAATGDDTSMLKRSTPTIQSSECLPDKYYGLFRYHSVDFLSRLF